MNAMAPFTPIPLPTNPAQLPSLPAWLQQRSAVLGSAAQPDSTARHREMPILPKALNLTSSERAEVQRHILELERFTRLDQVITLRGTSMTNEVALATMIAGLLLKGGKKLDQQASDAATEDYLDALEDLPAWSVREAIRKWNRGESAQFDTKKSHDFNWRPEPATLRRLAVVELSSVKRRIRHLQRVLDAVPLVEFSEGHCASMRERLSRLIHGITDKPMAQRATNDHSGTTE